MKGITSIELTRQEVLALLQLVRAKAAEVDRVQRGLEEGEGMDSQRHNALKQLRPQLELYGDLSMKLEGASREVG
ncbi:MAG: hypothetical protein WDA16_06570 [Candidatus Thermoplasmatota archaeon]